MLITEQGALDGEGFARSGFYFGDVSAVGDGVAQVIEGVGELQALRAADFSFHGDGLAESGFGFGEVVDVRQGIAELAQGIRDGGVLFAERRTGKSQCLSGHGFHLLVDAKFVVNLAEGEAKFDFDFGLAFEIGGEAGGGFVNNVAEECSVAAKCDAGADPIEHVGEEAGGLIAACGLDAGILGFVVSAAGLAAGLDEADGCESEAGDQRGGDGGGGGYGDFITANEFSGAIEARGRSGEDGLIIEEPVEVVSEITRGLIAEFTFFFEAAHDDPIEFATDQGGKFAGFNGALGGDDRVCGGVGDAGAGSGGFDFADNALHFGEDMAAKFFRIEWRRSGEELVEEDAEGVDIGAGVHVEAAIGLFGAHVFGGAEELVEFGEEGFIGEPVLHGFGDAEVDDFYDGFVVLGGDEHV